MNIYHVIVCLYVFLIIYVIYKDKTEENLNKHILRRHQKNKKEEVLKGNNDSFVEQKINLLQKNFILAPNNYHNLTS